VAFDHFDFDRLGTGLSPEDTDDRRPTVFARIDRGEVVKPFRGSLVNRKMLRALGFNDVAVGCEGFARKRCRE
jgi:hypothetical protein